MLCSQCKEPVAPNAFERHFLETDDSTTIYRARGCDACGHSGYRGRTGIYELIVADDPMREMIHGRASEQQLSHYARERFPSIREDGRAKVLRGITTVEEVMKATLDDGGT